jgi:P4 family phage/plasmid primase-like protien
MSRFAGRVLKKYGVCDKAYQVFQQRAQQCDPPLEQSELQTIWNSAVKFARKIQSQEGYIPPEEFNSDFDDQGLKPEDYSDLGEAKILAREFGNELKYTNATDLLRYDGQCWCEDKQMALGASLDFMDLQLQDAKDAVQAAEENLMAAGVDETIVKGRGRNLEKACAAGMTGMFFALLGADAYLKFVMKYRNYRNIVNVQNTVKPMVAIDVSTLDYDPNLLNTPYATYDLSQGLEGEQPHDPTDLITKITNVSPGNAGKEIWEDALNTFFCGDRELIDYVQTTVGMAAIGKVYQEHMIIAYGGGANGKSTFWNTIFRVLGTYAGKISADALTMGCKHNTRPEAAELKGKRLIIASEMEEGMRLNTAMVKQLCSTDEIQAEKKYKDPFHFVPSHTLVLYTNHLPKVGANDDGIWRRLIVIPFNAKITGKSDIKNYADYLYEKAGPYIMTWIINGAKKAIAAKFHTKLPNVVKEAIDRYRESNDWLGQFIEERCEVDPSYSEKSGELYQQYRFSCIQNGEYLRSTSDFYGALEKAGYMRRKSNKGSFVFGLKLKDGQDFLE